MSQINTSNEQAININEAENENVNLQENAESTSSIEENITAEPDEATEPEEPKESEEASEENTEEPEELIENALRFKDYNEHHNEIHDGLDALGRLDLESPKEEVLEEYDTGSSSSSENSIDIAPNINSYDYTLVEDSPQDTVTGNVLNSASSGDGENTFLWQNTNGIYGNLKVDDKGNFTYELDNSKDEVQSLSQDQTVKEEFFYTYTDVDGDISTGSLVINIKGTNDAPIASAETANILEDTLLSTSGTLQASDIDSEDKLIFSTNNSAGKYGTLILNADGTYTYTVNNTDPRVQALGAGESMTEVFNYTVTDNSGGSSTSSITITISGTNDAPTLESTKASINETASSISGTLPDAVDVDANDTFTYSIADNTSNIGDYGTFVVNPDGTYTYTIDKNSSEVNSLALGKSLTDTFRYQVSDGKGGIAINEITITIQGENNAPTAVDTTITLKEDTLTEYSGILPEGIDTDNGSVLSYIDTEKLGEYGKLIVKENGEYQFILDNTNPKIQGLGLGESISERYYYTIIDEYGAKDSAYVEVVIQGTNDLPAATIGKNTVYEDLDEVVQGALSRPQDVDKNDTVSFVAQTVTTKYGTLVLNTDGTYTYTLNSAAAQSLGKGEIFVDSIPYEVVDNHGGIGSSTIDITIHGQNDKPIIGDLKVEVQEDINTIITGNLPTPTDADANDILSFIARADDVGLYGTFTVNADGTYSYVLDNDNPIIQALGADEKLTERFVYTVTDSNGGIAQGYFDVVIQGHNDAPIALEAITSVVEDHRTTSYGSLASSVTDADANDSHSFVPSVIEGKYGTFTLNADGSYTYVLNNELDAVQGLTQGESLTESFPYTVYDSQNASSSNKVTVTIKGTNDVPTVEPAYATIQEGGDSVLTGKLNPIYDPDNELDGIFSENTYYTSIENTYGQYGNFTLNADGTYTYTLNNELDIVKNLNDGESLTEEFTYIVYDENGGQSTSTIEIKIEGNSATNSSGGDGGGG